jgi:tetratricopeptide (TPR) repeat protein
MSTNKKDEKTEEAFQEVESALSSTEHFIERNQRILSYALLGLVLLVSGYWLTKKYYYFPQEEKAEVAIFRAQIYFEKDSFKLALNGDGMNLGFVEIARKYSSTKAGNLANYYAGISYLNSGNFQKAIDYLEDFSTEDNLVEAVSIGAIGDAYLELGNKDKAANYYEKAAKNDNEFTAPTYLFKLGLLQEDMGKTKDALENYQIIKTKYKKSAEYTLIDKYITRASLK